MQKTTKIVFSAILLVTAAIAGTLAARPASAQSSSGQFNAQTQFPVGTQVQIASIYGLEKAAEQVPTPYMGQQNFGNHTWRNGGQNWTHNQIPPGGPVNQEWNLTYLRSTPTANSSITVTAQVTNDTKDGGVIWTVQSGSISYNGTTLTITEGKGGIGEFDHIVMIGNATDSKGNTLRWSLDGLATLYNGTVIVALTGGVTQLLQSTSTTKGPGQRVTLSRLVSLTYIATLS
jgi:hypothetical protein